MIFDAGEFLRGLVLLSLILVSDMEGLCKNKILSEECLIPEWTTDRSFYNSLLFRGYINSRVTLTFNFLGGNGKFTWNRALLRIFAEAMFN